MRFPEAAHADGEFVKATELRGRIFNVHVRRATMGELSLENTHPFCLGNYTLGHNGTIVRYPRLLEPGMRRAEGDTDSEHLFNLLMHDFDPGGAGREPARDAARNRSSCSPFSGLNVLFSRRREAVRLPPRPVRAALAARGPGSCSWPPSA